jgi:hypothetical protein
MSPAAEPPPTAPPSLTLSNRRLRAAVEMVLGVGLLLSGVLALPLGLESATAAPLVLAGYTLGPGGDGAPVHALAALAIRAFGWLPLADVATRANLASLAAATAAVVWLARLTQELLADLAVGRTGPPAREGACEAFAAAGGVAGVTFGLGMFVAFTSAGGTAISLALLAAFWLRALRLMRGPGRPRDGLYLALLAGIAFGADGFVALVCWPAALLIWTRAFRRGERWPRLAPVLALAGSGLGLHAAATAGQTHTALAWAADAFGALAGASPGDLAALLTRTAAALLTEIGAIAGLTIAVGLVLLGARAPRQALVLLLAASLALVVGAGGEGRTAAAWAAALATLAVPLSVGIAHLAGTLGPARGAAALVIAVVALGWPALDGGARRWDRPVDALDRVLHQARTAGPRAQLQPDSAASAELLRYAQALGIRPDLRLAAPRYHVLRPPIDVHLDRP